MSSALLRKHEVLTIKEVAKILRCSAWKIYRKVESGELKPIEFFGKPYKFDREYIQGLIRTPLDEKSNRSLKTELAGRATKNTSISIFPKNKKGKKESLWG